MQKTFNYDDVPVLETTGGKLKGYFYRDAYIFKGIPYAQAKRFQMPEPVTPWEGVRDVTSYGFVCPLLSQETPNGELMVPHRYWPQDENCQNLNIWSPSLDAQAKKPVIVWIHGGGYTAGSSIEQVAYDGLNLCTRGDVVVVTINHRLNILGYLDLSPFGEKYANSANVGHADMVAALQWIHDNIAVFGGDPENVTIFGQSGGGMKVADLMQIEAADGLFQKGLIMSGVGDSNVLPSCKGDGREIVTALMEDLGFDSVEQLESVSYFELARSYNKVSPLIAMKGGYIGCGPLKNEYYAGAPLEEGFRPHAFTIPLVIGSVFGEFAFNPAAFSKTALTDEQTLELLRPVYGEHAEDIAAEFARAYPDKHVSDVLFLDRAMRQPSKRLARLHAEGKNAPVYLYNFTLEFPYQNRKIAWHCSDIPFIFGNTDKVEVCDIPGVSEKLEAQLMGSLLAFAKNGDPNHEGLPAWPAVTGDDMPTMIFDTACEVRHNYDDALYELIDSILPPFNLMEIMAQENVQH